MTIPRSARRECSSMRPEVMQGSKEIIVTLGHFPRSSDLGSAGTRFAARRVTPKTRPSHQEDVLPYDGDAPDDVHRFGIIGSTALQPQSIQW